MRRSICAVCTVAVAASIVAFSTLAAEAQSADQYGSSDGTEAPPAAPRSGPEDTAPDEEAPDPPWSGASSSKGGFVSQGSIVEADSPEAVAAREDLAEEERLPDFSRVVDNTTKGGVFQAPGWRAQRGAFSHGGSFVAAEGGKSPARFGVKIPSSHDYSVYVWWPELRDGGTARYGVQAASGMRWSEVEQRADSSGMWIKLGTYDMEEGRRTVQVAAESADEGRVVADAVAVVRGMAAPPEDQATTFSGEQSVVSKRLRRFGGRDIVRQAKEHTGDRYRYATCTGALKSCTCLTKRAVGPFGHRLGMGELGQWRYNRSWKVPKSRLRPGDEVFFKEGGSGYITHVGIYSGNGNIVHASSYFNRVVESKMKYLRGYYGAKRFKSR